MVEPDSLRYTKLPLNNGSGAMPALGFGTLGTVQRVKAEIADTV
jgi:hypothetical protein